MSLRPVADSPDRIVPQLARRAASRLRHELNMGWALCRRQAAGGPLAVVACTGQAPCGGARSLVFVGRPALVPDFHALFAAAPRQLTCAAGPLWHLRALRRQAMARRADVMIFERLWGSKVAPGAGYATHLHGQLALAADAATQMAAVRSAKLRAELSADAQAGFEVRVSQASADLATFYQQMYSTVDRRRFGDNAGTMPWPALQRIFARGGRLLQIFAAQRWCSAVVVVPQRRTLRIIRFGIAQADRQSMAKLRQLCRLHDLAAMAHARAIAAHTVDFGTCRAVATDPIYQHKLALGCRFAIAARTPRFDLCAHPAAQAAIIAEGRLVIPGHGQPTALKSDRLHALPSVT